MASRGKGFVVLGALMVVGTFSATMWSHSKVSPADPVSMEDAGKRYATQPEPASPIAPPEEVARSEAGAGPAMAQADTPGMEGAGDQPPPAPEVHREQVRLRVLDHLGQPASDVAVSLQEKYFLRDPRAIASTWTDDAGEAVLHSAELTALVAAGGSHLGAPALRVVPEIPMTDETAVRVAWPVEPETVHELRLPALGSVTVHVLGPDGEPFLEPVRVSARWIPTLEVGTEVYGGYHRCHDQHRITTTGSTRYGFVGSGVSMTFLAVAPAYGNGSAVDVPITAPPDGNQDVTIRLGARRPIVRCRVLGVDGEPVRGEELTVRVWHGPESKRKRPFSNPFPVPTDEDGWMEFPFDRELDANHGRRLYLERLAGGTDAAPPAHWGRVALTLPERLSSRAEHDLGTGQLVAPELLQEGHVFDFRGEPASNVRVTFIAQEPGEPVARNKPEYLGSVYSGDDGSFQFRGFETPPGMRVTLYGHVRIDGSMTRCYGEHLDVAVGDRTATFLLAPPPDSSSASTGSPKGTLQVSALFDEGLPGPYFAFQLLHEQHEWEPLPMSLLEEAPWSVPLEAGNWSLRVFLPGLDHDLVRVDRLLVRPGELLADGRCLPLDLRGLASHARFPVQRPNGAPWRGKNLHVRIVSPPIRGRMRTGEDGWLDAAFPAGCTGVELSPDGENWTAVVLAGMEPVTLMEGR